MRRRMSGPPPPTFAVPYDAGSHVAVNGTRYAVQQFHFHHLTRSEFFGRHHQTPLFVQTAATIAVTYFIRIIILECLFFSHEPAYANPANRMPSSMMASTRSS